MCRGRSSSASSVGGGIWSLKNQVRKWMMDIVIGMAPLRFTVGKLSLLLLQTSLQGALKLPSRGFLPSRSDTLSMGSDG